MALIQPRINKDDPFSSLERVTPERSVLEPETDTVEGRVQNLIKKNSPLMQMAETSAKQAMAPRGLVNSSMAIGEGQKAVYGAAVPIATTDASNSLQNKQFNANSGNQANQFNATNTNTAAFTQFDANTKKSMQELQGTQALQQIETQGSVTSRLQAERANLDREFLVADTASKAQLQAQRGAIDLELANLGGRQAMDQINARGKQAADLQKEAGDIQLMLQGAEGANRVDLLNKSLNYF
jgi:hypothetical protein